VLTGHTGAGVLACTVDIPDKRARAHGVRCCVGTEACASEGWHTHTLRLAPQFAALFSGASGGWAGLEWPRTAPFPVPASVRVLHLLSPGLYRIRTRYTPTLAGASPQELHIDTDAWDKTTVCTCPKEVLLLIASCGHLSYGCSLPWRTAPWKCFYTNVIITG